MAVPKVRIRKYHFLLKTQKKSWNSRNSDELILDNQKTDLVKNGLMIRSVPDYVALEYSLLPERFPLVAKIHLVKVDQEGYENSILDIFFDELFWLNCWTDRPENGFKRCAWLFYVALVYQVGV
jgi:hypothetical protein